ncbi:metal-dependent hydrolase [Chloroflexota bacterium]
MSEGMVSIEYFGGAAFKVTTAKGTKILIDPFIKNNPLCPQECEYFYDTDLVLVTHGAYDHRGDSVEIMNNSQAVMICGHDVAHHAMTLKVPKERIRTTIYGDQKEFSGIKVKTVFVQHISRVVSDSGELLAQGVPLGFIISTEDGIRIFHPGDTSIHGDLNQIGMLYKPNVMMVGVGSVKEGTAVEMDVRDAAFATLMVGPDVVFPMHYPPGSNSPAEFVQALKIIAPNIQAMALPPGGQITYCKYQLKQNGH